MSSLPLFAQVTTHGQKSPTTPVGWVFDHYQLTVSDWNPRLRIELTPRVGSTADLYVRRGQAPTLQDWDIREATPHTSAELTIVDQSSTPALTTDVWHIGVWRDRNTTYSISYRLEPDVSSRSGFGAVPWDDSSGRGTTFRTFAPNATRAWVTGSFNGWSQSTAEMGDEAYGNWSLDVRNVRAGAEYKFVFETSQGLITRNDSQARRLTHSSGNGVVVDHGDYVWQNSFTMPAWNDLVVYEMHLGTFNDVAGGLPGTLTTAGQRLDYLKDLGVNAIELMPFCEFPGEFSWGYNYAYPWAVESHYGSPEVLKAFVDAAHGRGMAVFCDLVFNHWGPTDMDLWQYDGWSPDPQYGGIYFYNDWRSQTPWGDTRPDYTRGEVRTYIRDNVLSWLEDYRFDGIRFDSTSYMRFANGTALPEAWSLLQWLNDEINARQGWKFSVAEDMWSNDWITRGTGSGGAGFDSQWDPNFVHPMRDAMVAQSDGQRDMGAVRDAIIYSYDGDPVKRVIFTESHDEVANGKSRVPEEIWPGNASSWFSKKRSTLGAAVLFTSPGVPMLFQGQEFLEDGYFRDDDPVDWTKLTTFGGIHDLYQQLIRNRRNLNGNTAGLKGAGVSAHHVNNSDKVIAYHRWEHGGPGDDVVVVANFSSQTFQSYLVGMPHSGTWHVRFNSDSTQYDSSFSGYGDTSVQASFGPRDGMNQSASLRLAPYTAVILSQ